MKVTMKDGTTFGARPIVVATMGLNNVESLTFDRDDARAIMALEDSARAALVAQLMSRLNRMANR